MVKMNYDMTEQWQVLTSLPLPPEYQGQHNLTNVFLTRIDLGDNQIMNVYNNHLWLIDTLTGKDCAIYPNENWNFISITKQYSMKSVPEEWAQWIRRAIVLSV